MSLSLMREKDRNEGFRKCDWAYRICSLLTVRPVPFHGETNSRDPVDDGQLGRLCR